MNLGKSIRLNRLFSNPSGKFFSVAVDHFFGYNLKMPDELLDMNNTIDQIVSGEPDALTMHIGIARKIWSNYAGRIPLILQSTITRSDDSAYEIIATPEDAIKLGADAYAIVTFVRGDTEAEHLRVVANYVREAEFYNLPVVCHIYPRDYTNGSPIISYKSDDVAWAVHCALEVGVDVIKVPYCNDINAFAQIVHQTPVPIVAAGGPKQGTIQSALKLIADVVKSGAKGATIGRNVWGSDKIIEVIKAFKAVIHEGKSVDEALSIVGAHE